MLTKFPFQIVMLVFVISCNNNKNNQQDQNVQDTLNQARIIRDGEKFFEGIDLPHFVYSIETDKEQKLITPTGTEIMVPKNAFVDKAGKEIKSKVTLNYKEIRTPSDIIIENVNMTYDSAGVSYQFQTAGMFDLRAFSGNEEAFLKKGQHIEISYISDKSGDFNFYHYNGKWDYECPAKTDLPLNEQKLKKTGATALKPVLADPSNDLIIDIKTNYSKIPELRKYNKIIWKYTGNLKKDEVASILSSNVYNPELVSSNKAGEYLYSFKSRTGNYEFPIAPVFSPKAFQKALNQYNSELENNGIIKIKRTVNVTELGLMNYDRIYHRSDAVLVNADFKLNNTKIEGLPLFHITGEDDVIVRLEKDTKMYYSPALKNKIVAILPGKKVAVLSTVEFLKSVKAANNRQQINFDLKQLDVEINSAEDLNKIISEL